MLDYELLKIKEVKTKGDLKVFNNFVLSLYKKNPYYVPYMYGDEMGMLNPKFNLSLDDCEVSYVLCLYEKKVVGRVAVILQKEFNKVSKTNGVRFSRFDSIDDSNVAKKLFDYVKEFALLKKASFIVGPFGYNETDRSGYLTKGFDVVGSFGTNYNYEYYDKLFKENGYYEENTWVEAYISRAEGCFEKMRKLSDYVIKKGNFRISQENTFNKFAKKWGWKSFQCLNRAFAKLPGFVPFKEEMYDQIAKQYAMVVKPEWLTSVINDKDEVVGFAICFPSLAEAMQKTGGKLFPFGFIKVFHDISHPKIVDLCLIGVDPEYQDKGINTILISHILDAIERNNISITQTYAMHTDNYKVLSQFKLFKTEIKKERKTVRLDL